MGFVRCTAYARFPKPSVPEKIRTSARTGPCEGSPKTAGPAGSAASPAFGAVTVRAGPGLFPGQVAATSAAVGIPDADQLEVFLPIGPLLFEGRGAVADLHPLNGAVSHQTRLPHVRRYSPPATELRPRVRRSMASRSARDRSFVLWP